MTEDAYNHTINQNSTDFTWGGDYNPDYSQGGVYNALEELQSILRYYKLYLDTELDIVNKKVKFIIGRTMTAPINIKLWEHGVKNYGKWVADVTECQGVVAITDGDTTTWYMDIYKNVSSLRWILTINNELTVDTSKRDIYPIKRKIAVSSESMTDANMLALETLLDTMYNEDIELPANAIGIYNTSKKVVKISGIVGAERLTTKLEPLFEALFQVYVKRGGGKYKDLPCGELQYDATGLTKFKIGYRYTSVNFI